MLKNYLMVTLRTLKRNRVYTLVNILGLTLGLATVLTIFLLIRYELSFEQMHLNKDRIYRVVMSRKNSAGMHYTAETPYPATAAIRMDFPALEKVTGIHFNDEVLVRMDDKKFQENRVIFADSSFLDIFNFGYGPELVMMGDAERSLREPGFAILSEDLAEKYFKGESPLGRRLLLNNKLEVEVGAVIRNAPPDTHLRYNMLVSYASLTPAYTDFPLDSWGFVTSGYTYVLLPEEMDPGILEQRLSTLVHKYYNEEQQANTNFALQSLEDIHFDTTYHQALSPPVNRQYLMIMAVVGIFILLIACINFINLSTAISFRKSKEVGVRKTLGALKSNLIWQYSGEAFVLTFISWAIALVLLLQLLPILNNYLQKDILLNLSIEGNGYFWLFSLLVIIVVALLSGLYPAFVISGFPPVTALKNKVTSNSQSSIWLRRGLVLFQFLIAQVLIIVTLVISSQMTFIRSKSPGFDREAIINVNMPQSDSLKLAQFYDRLLSETGIEGISFGMAAPNANNNAVTPFYETQRNPEDRYLVNVKPVDQHYLNNYRLDLLAGRWFEERDLGATDMRFVVNEQAIKKLSYHDPEDALGKNITTGFGNQSGDIIGVVADFHLSSLHEEIIPVCFVPFPNLFFHAGIKLSPGNYAQSIAKVQAVWTDLFPDDLFQYEFMDARLASLYEEDVRVFTLFRFFSGISIFIGCLGLFGLISFLVEQKRKEVSIRKVLGASVGQIVFLFSKEFSQLVLLAFLMAIPMAWYFAHHWLQNFAYRVNISYWVFLAGGLTAFVIAFASVAWQSVKAALENPVNNLKDE